MKKIISLILSAVMLLSFNIPSFAASFSDFNTAHWAYSYVTELVSEGTINGYADGTFRPEGTVTRAEFVKMIGEGPETAQASYDDVPSSHWAYKYIMSSGLKPLAENMFMPDTPITRGNVAELLWKRAGAPMGITAPPVVHRQSNNFDAASWVYTNGIMVGDDYVDLRLGDTLTRAEASALIIRSRSVSDATPKTIFAEKLNPEIYEAVYKAFNLIDRPYDADAAITNGELAMAVAKLHSGDDFPMYEGISATATFEHPYAQPLNMLCRYYLGLENDNAAYADKNATLKEAVAALMFVTSRVSPVYIPVATGETYSKYTSAGNEDFDKIISKSYVNGVWFTTEDAMEMDKDVTMKELALLVLELDGFAGFHRLSIITPEKTTLKNAKIRAGFETYPQNAKDYRIILKDLPNSIYERPFAASVSAPAETFKSTNTFRDIFTSMLESWVRALSSVGYRLEVTYYPGVSVNNGNGFTMRVGIKFTDIPANTRLGDLVNCANPAEGDVIVSNGSTIYADVQTGKTVDDVVIGIGNMSLTQLIY